jgi:Peptidase_C39 like family
MITDLFVATSGIDGGVVARVVPPACRRQSSSSAVSAVSERELLIEFPAWRPRVGARHLVPSFSMLTDVPYALRFEAATEADGWSSWIATATIGPADFPVLPMSGTALTCDVDVYASTVPLEQLRLRVRLGAADVKTLLASPWIATLSASDLGPREASGPARAPRLPVPALSQRQAPPEIAMRICSPTSVAMVLGYLGAAASPLEIAAEAFHAASDSYGVWPAAIRAAGLRGVAGYLLRFPDWPSAVWCLERGLPIVASIRYAADELPGAPLRETSGHLIVLTGCDEHSVFVNDPVAPTAADVPRRYRLDDLQRAWLDRAGVGYVLFNPRGSGQKPAPDSRAAPGAPTPATGE